MADLRPVVDEAEQPARYRGEEHAERGPVVRAENEERHRHRQHHDQAAHRRGAGLAGVPGGALLADLLAELLLAQVLDELRAEEHAERERGDARDEDLAEHLPGCEYAFEARGPRTLDEHAVTLARELLEQRARLLRRRRGVALATEGASDRQRRPPDRDQHVDPQLVGEPADLAMEALGVRAELG